MAHMEDQGRESAEDALLLSEGDPLLERAVQLYLELRLLKRPPESAPGAERKALRWVEEEARSLGREVDPSWPSWLARAFLDVEGDVAEAQVRRRQARRRPSRGGPLALPERQGPGGP